MLFYHDSSSLSTACFLRKDKYWSTWPSQSTRSSSYLHFYSHQTVICSAFPEVLFRTQIFSLFSINSASTLIISECHMLSSRRNCSASSLFMSKTLHDLTEKQSHQFLESNCPSWYFSLKYSDDWAAESSCVEGVALSQATFNQLIRRFKLSFTRVLIKERWMQWYYKLSCTQVDEKNLIAMLRHWQIELYEKKNSQEHSKNQLSRDDTWYRWDSPL